MELVSGSVSACGQESASRNLPSTWAALSMVPEGSMGNSSGGRLGVYEPPPNTEAWLEKAKL